MPGQLLADVLLGPKSLIEPVAQQDGIDNINYLYIQMEYCEGKTLRDLINDGLQQNTVRLSTPSLLVP